MSGTYGFTFTCGYCGRPMVSSVVAGGMQVHEECTHGPGWEPPRVKPMPPAVDGCRTLAPLTEADVLRIVREEINRVDERRRAAGLTPEAPR